MCDFRLSQVTTNHAVLRNPAQCSLIKFTNASDLLPPQYLLKTTAEGSSETTCRNSRTYVISSYVFTLQNTLKKNIFETHRFFIVGMKVQRDEGTGKVLRAITQLAVLLGYTLSGCSMMEYDKVKVTPEQATKAQRGSRCIALLFLQPPR